MPIEGFLQDGRGPELLAVHLASGSSRLVAVDFRDPDSSRAGHLRFQGVQAYQFTPEEVADHSQASVDWNRTAGSALVCLGRSAWLESFSQTHLRHCSHYRAMFYDEYLDVICEGVVVADRTYADAS